MDKDLISGLENFDAVWQRVSGAGKLPYEPEKPIIPKNDGNAEISQMCEFMQDEANDSALYREMALRTKGNAATAFMGMSLDERRHLNELQLEYFILTGDTYNPKPDKPEINGLLSRMRQSYISEGKGSAEYAKAAAETKNESLRRIYAAASRDEARHQETLRKMIKQSIK